MTASTVQNNFCKCQRPSLISNIAKLQTLFFPHCNVFKQYEANNFVECTFSKIAICTQSKLLLASWIKSTAFHLQFLLLNLHESIQPQAAFSHFNHFWQGVDEFSL